MRQVAVALAMLNLAACSEVPEHTESPGVVSTPTPVPVETDNGIGDDAGPLENAAAVADHTIPTRFHGVWDYVDGTCQPESDLRMEISGDRIVFYESVGEVTDVVSETNGDRIVTLAMSGEGETWVSKLRLQMDSRKMRMVVLPENDDESSASDRQYSARKRCS